MDELLKHFDKILGEIEGKKENSWSEFENFSEQKWFKPDLTIQIVLLGHLYIEQCIDRIISNAFLKPKKIAQFNFSKKN